MSAKQSVALILIALAALAAFASVAPTAFDTAPATDAATRDPAAGSAPQTTGHTRLLVVGDSLSAGYGLADVGDGWVSLLQQRLARKGYGIDVVNASISGDTTEGGATRLPRALATHQPAVVVIELGGNDGLRGIPIEITRRNLERMVTASQAAGAQVALLGMRIPPNYGIRYTEQFEQTFTRVADEYALPFEPFFLADVALDPVLMQPDGIHPTAAAQPAMLDRAWPAIEAAVEAAVTAPSSPNKEH